MEGSGRGLIRDNIRHLPEGTEGNHKKPLRTVGDLDEIRMGYFPNIRHNTYRLGPAHSEATDKRKCKLTSVHQK
jgi:hypothetical protein